MLTLLNAETTPVPQPLDAEVYGLDFKKFACQACVTLVNGVEQFFSGDLERGLTQAMLSTACGALAWYLVPVCGVVVDQFYPQLADLIARGLDGKQTCRNIGLC